MNLDKTCTIAIYSVAAVLLCIVLYAAIVPLLMTIQPTRIIEEGSYEGIQIGFTKEQVWEIFSDNPKITYISSHHQARDFRGYVHRSQDLPRLYDASGIEIRNKNSVLARVAFSDADLVRFYFRDEQIDDEYALLVNSTEKAAFYEHLTMLLDDSRLNEIRVATWSPETIHSVNPNNFHSYEKELLMNVDEWGFTLNVEDRKRVLNVQLEFENEILARIRISYHLLSL